MLSVVQRHVAQRANTCALNSNETPDNSHPNSNCFTLDQLFLTMFEGMCLNRKAKINKI